MLRRKKGLRKISKKREALNKEWNPQRREFVNSTKKCMCCKKLPPCDCHEILRGTFREKCLQEPKLWLALCRECHDKMDDTKAYPVERQLAMRAEAEIDAMIERVEEVTRNFGIFESDVVRWINLPHDQPMREIA